MDAKLKTKWLNTKTLKAAADAIERLAKMLQEAHDKWEQSLNEIERLRLLVGVQRPDREALARTIDPSATQYSAAFFLAQKAADRVLALFPVSVQRPEDVREKIKTAVELGPWFEAFAKNDPQVGTPEIDGFLDEIADAALSVLALPHTGQPQEGRATIEDLKAVLRRIGPLLSAEAADRIANDTLERIALPAPQAGCAKEGELIEKRIGKYERDLARHVAPSQPDGICKCPACIIDRGILAELKYMKMAARYFSASPPPPVAESGWQSVLKFARRAAFLGAHINDREDGPDILARELHRLYGALTDLDGGEEPDLTFCCGCREEIEIADGQEQWVLDGAKYHKRCYEAIVADQRLPEPK